MMVQPSTKQGNGRKDARPIEWTDALLEDAIAGKFKVTRFGQPLHFKLSPGGRKEYETAKRQGYIVRSRGGNAPVENVYWHWCEIHGKPVISVRPKRLYASISCDMIVAAVKLDKAAMLTIDALRTCDRRESYQLWHDNEPRVCYAALERIPIADAETVAAKVYAAAIDCIKRHGGGR